eukprot:1383727-Rhodomonas_salina.3
MLLGPDMGYAARLARSRRLQPELTWPATRRSADFRRRCWVTKAGPTPSLCDVRLSYTYAMRCPELT